MAAMARGLLTLTPLPGRELGGRIRALGAGEQGAAGDAELGESSVMPALNLAEPKMDRPLRNARVRYDSKAAANNVYSVQASNFGSTVKAIKPVWVTSGIALSIVAGLAWSIHRSEQYARQQLVYEREESSILTPPPPEMAERYEIALASVEQTSMITKAVAALRRNDFIKCTVEIELALEQNRTARSSITPDFYENGELQQLYRTALKTWLDGYPLDYGKLLQLRNMLAIPTGEAEAIEAEVQSQSDVYVI